jgi:hypothetical protein
MDKFLEILNSNEKVAWQDCTSLTSFPLIDTTNVTDFSVAFKNCKPLI